MQNYSMVQYTGQLITQMTIWITQKYRSIDSKTHIKRVGDRPHLHPSVRRFFLKFIEIHQCIYFIHESALCHMARVVQSGQSSMGFCSIWESVSRKQSNSKAKVNAMSIITLKDVQSKLNKFWIEIIPETCHKHVRNMLE